MPNLSHGPSIVTDAEAKDRVWSISQRYESLLKLQRAFADAQRAHINAQGDRFKAEVFALSTEKGAEQWLQAQKKEHEAKAEALQRRVLLLQSLHELRQWQIEDLMGHIEQEPQSPGSARSEPEAEALQHRVREPQHQPTQADLCQRLAASERKLEDLINQTASAKRLAESIGRQQEAQRAAELLQVAMEVQDEVGDVVSQPAPGSTLIVAEVGAGRPPPEVLEPLEPLELRPRPAALAPEFLALVMEEVGLASEQLATLSPWRSAASGEETPSTRHSLSEVDPQSQAREWRSPAEESTKSTSPSRVAAGDTPGNDGIDLALMSFLSPRRNRLRRSLFTREAKGLYRYGTSRLRLRFAQGELQASGCEVEAWEPLEELLRKVEVEQSQRLQRARQRAKVLRKP